MYDKPSMPITIILSIICPGAGHLYLGLKRRGTQIILLYFLLHFLNSASYTFAFDSLIKLGILATIVIFTLEAIRFNKLLILGINIDDLPFIKLKILEPTTKNIGILLVIVGSLLLIDSILSLSFFEQYREIFESIIKKALFPLILIIGGIYLIINKEE